MLSRVAPLVDRWYLCDLPIARAIKATDLVPHIQALPAGEKALAGTFASPSLALSAALGAAGPADRIVVFGSFYTVGPAMETLQLY